MDGRMLFEDWLPDMATQLNGGLTRAAGCIPVKSGYDPMPSLEDLGHVALDAYVRGTTTARDTSGNGYNFAGTGAKLYRIASSGPEDVTRLSGGDYSADRWDFLIVQNLCVAVNINDEPQAVALPSPGAFSLLSADAPRARYAAFIGPQVVFANLIDPIAGAVPDGFRYPNILDVTDWPDPTDLNASLPVQAGFTAIEGNGGPITAIVSGSEVGAILQERQVNRVEYAGGDVIYQVDRVEKTRGGIIPGFAVPFGRNVLYCSEDGFYVFDYLQSTRIGDNRVDRFFLGDLDFANAHRVSALKMVDVPVIAILYPSVASDGTPDRIIFWNHQVNKWAGPTELSLDWITRVIQPGQNESLEDIGDIDAFVGTFDSALFSSGGEFLGAWSTGHKLGSFTGPALEAIFETGDLEHEAGFMSLVNAVRPLIDGASPRVQVAAMFDRRRREALINYRSERGLNRQGEVPVRAKGRYHRYRARVPAGGFEHAVGLDFEYERLGRR